MKKIWAPWRMEFLRGNSSGEKGCIFCIRDKAEEDARRLIVHRSEHAFVIMNKFPYSNGHLMVAPYRHTADTGELEEAEILDMHRLLVSCRKVLQQEMGAEGFNLGMNLGQVAGAGVADHLHMHIVPRWCGDTNFMPIFAEVRVIPEHLQETYRILADAFKGVPL